MSRDKRKIRYRKKRRKAGRRIAVIVIELILLTALSVAAYAMFKYDKMDVKVLNMEKLEAYRDTGPYTNIALFGLDSREGEIDGGVQSDCIMIASINNETNDVKIISVYRDTLLQKEEQKYGKANSAYHDGGPEEAIALLNRNFDLDIHNYVSVNFGALVDVIDALGGIEIDVQPDEISYICGYATEIMQVIGKETVGVTEPGLQTLNGIQATAYARIRYTDGMDFKRAERQRVVLQKVAEKAKQANLLTLNAIVDKVFPQISTSLTLNDMLGFAAHALDYNIVETSGFPYAVTTSEDVRGHSGSFVVPVGFSNNVIQLHQNLFGETDYQPSEKVQEINAEIIYLTDVTEESEALNTTFDGDVHHEETE